MVVRCTPHRIPQDCAMHARPHRRSTPVRIKANTTLGSNYSPHLAHPSDVLDEGCVRPSDLNFHRATIAESSQNGPDLIGENGGHRGVDGNAWRAKCRIVVFPRPAKFDGRAQPRCTLRIRIISEWTELAPPSVSAKDQRFTDGNPAKRSRKAQRHHMSAIEQFVQGWPHLASLPYARRLVA